MSGYHGSLTDHEEFSLFSFPQDRAGHAISQSAPISDRQVAAIRTALTAAGKTTMDERQRFIEECLGRTVANVRTLTSNEAVLVLKILSQQATKSTGGSSWDDRDEETWIDKL